VDLETVEAIDRLTKRIESFESSFRIELRDGLADVRGELADLHGGHRGMRSEVADVRTGLADVHIEIAGVHTEIADVRRHAVILNEATRDDIRLVAEAVETIAVKIDSRQP
jgi:hypothetical protein